MVLTMRLLDWESSTLTTRPLKLTPSFPKFWIEKNVFASVHDLGFNVKLLFFSPKILGISLTLCQKVVNTAGRIFLPGGENLRSDFDDSEIVNTEHQLKSKLA